MKTFPIRIEYGTKFVILEVCALPHVNDQIICVIPDISDKELILRVSDITHRQVVRNNRLSITILVIDDPEFVSHNKEIYERIAKGIVL